MGNFILSEYKGKKLTMAKALAVSFLFLLVIVSSTKAQHCGDVGANSLKLQIAIFRHGDRTPYSTYPNDIYQRDFWAPWGGFSGLTQLGQNQEYQLGQWFRQCYGSSINSSYIEEDIYIRSTDYSRTLMSAEAFLAGLFPPEGYQKWGDHQLGELWQAVPIHTIPKDEDYLLKAQIKCPPYDALVEEFWQHSPELQQIQKDNQAMLDYIAENAGLTVPGNLREVNYYVSDAVFVETVHNLTLPKWINETVQNTVIDWYSVWLLAETAGNDEIVKFAGGQLLSNIQQTMAKKYVLL